MHIQQKRLNILEKRKPKSKRLMKDTEVPFKL